MKDSVAKRVFWLVIFGALVLSMVYGSFVWSLGQTIQFTQLLVPGSKTGGVIFGIFVQFSPTAFLYLASSYDQKKPDEQNMRLWWLVAFWGVSLFDALTNVGARFDDISIKGLPITGFDNADFAEITQWMMIVMGVVLDFAIVFAEELLGNFLGVFFDNIAALITLLGGRPPRWLGMASSVSRSVGGQNAKQDGRHDQNKKQPKGNRPDNRHGRPDIDSNRPSPPNRDPRNIPVRGRGQERHPITIRHGDRD